MDLRDITETEVRLATAVLQFHTVCIEFTIHQILLCRGISTLQFAESVCRYLPLNSWIRKGFPSDNPSNQANFEIKHEGKHMRDKKFSALFF